MAVNQSGQSTIIFPIIKVVVAGDGGVGKTSLILRYCTGVFPETQAAPVGADFQIKIVDAGSTSVKLSIWDIAGQEQFGDFRDSFYRGARAIALMYDIANPTSMEDLPRWQQEIARVCPTAKFIVVGNKIDLARRTPRAQVEEWAASLGYPYMECSALTAEGVDAIFASMVRLTFKPRPAPPAP